MAEAVRAQSRAQHQKTKARKETVESLRANLAKKKFADLSKSDKEDVLKLLAVQLGIIQDDNE